MNIEPSKWAYAASEEIAPSYNEFDVLAAAYTIDNLAIEPAIAQLRADLTRVTGDWHRLGKLCEEYEHAQVGLKRDLARVTAELEQAEQRNAELVAALEELYETANRFPTFDGSRLASALDSASAALARNRAAQEASK